MREIEIERERERVVLIFQWIGIERSGGGGGGGGDWWDGNEKYLLQIFKCKLCFIFVRLLKYNFVILTSNYFN